MISLILLISIIKSSKTGKRKARSLEDVDFNINIIQIGPTSFTDIIPTVGEQGDLLIESSVFLNAFRYFYGLKSNGRAYFYDYSENSFTPYKELNLTLETPKFISENMIIKIDSLSKVSRFFLIIAV